MAQNRLSGINPQAYQGVEASSPPQFVYFTKDPTPRDYYNWNLGTIWLNQLTRTLWVLVNLNNHVATWLPLVTGAPVINQLNVDGNIPVFPLNGVVEVFGIHGINTTTTPSRVNIGINNTITLGDLVVLAPGAPALTIASGTISFTSSNTGIGGGALLSLTAGVNNTAVGIGALASCTTGLTNTAVGGNALLGLTTGQVNCAFGAGTLQNVTTTNGNSAFGAGAMNALFTGARNTALGPSLIGILTGNDNIAIGVAGNNYLGAESNNIVIGNQGVLGESDAIRIGTAQTICYMAGIRGITTTLNDAIPVLISSTGQLGTISSSRKYKENIHDLGFISNSIYNLRPVRFNLKADKSKRENYGLIAEEVEEAIPNLVVYNSEDTPETVRYMDLIPLMLNEMIKLNGRIKALEELYGSESVAGE